MVVERARGEPGVRNPWLRTRSALRRSNRGKQEVGEGLGIPGSV